jgi:hypothetical protein
VDGRHVLEELRAAVKGARRDEFESRSGHSAKMGSRPVSPVTTRKFVVVGFAAYLALTAV